MARAITINTKRLENDKVNFENELSKLRSAIVTSKETKGSILLSGDRGVGKTSLVIELENELINDPQYKFIWINAIHLGSTEAIQNNGTPEHNAESEKALSLHHLLKYLVEELSRKTSRTKALKQIKRTLYLHERSLGIDRTFGGNLSNTPSIGISASVGKNIAERWVGYSTIELASRLQDYLSSQVERRSFFGIVAYIIHAIILIPKLVKEEQFWSIVKRKVSTKAHKLWKQLLLLLGVEHLHLVFVFDELDNYESSSDSTYTLLNLLKSFKNLFTLSKCTFIFITSPRVFSIVNNAKSIHIPDGSGKDWDKFRTLFNKPIYFKRATKEVLEGYISPLLSSDDSQLKGDIIDFLTLTSYGNIHNLKRELDRYTYTLAGKSQIDFSLIDSTKLESLVTVFRVSQRVYERMQITNDVYIEDLTVLAIYEILNDYWNFLNDRQSSTLTKEYLIKLGHDIANNRISHYLSELFMTFSSIIKGAPDGINFGENSEPIRWIEVSQNIKDIEDVNRISKNYITPDERKFYKLLEQTKLFTKKTFKANDLNEPILLNDHKIVSQTNLDAINELRNIEIKKGLFERSSEVTSKAISALEEINANLDRFWNYGNNLLIRKDTPQSIEFNRDGNTIKLNGNGQSITNYGTKLYLHKVTEEGGTDRNFTLKITVSGEVESAVISVLAYDSLSYENDVNDSMYIAQIGIGSYTENWRRTGIFRKEAGQPVEALTEIEGVNNRLYLSEIGQQYEMIIRKKGDLLVYSIKSSTDSTPTTIGSCKINTPIYHLVLSGQVGAVQVMNIDLAKSPIK